ncbi:hypothetical protein [Chitinophaga pinensis]|uniref:Uncharacterized protein n=1 Tax=Chitinophaga pinensis TaxID=79329 RepID=A0A5C6LW17_9BACT|nr:hypothetical protein [Chitinophaga pinensis]TWW00847.1 hypothetical protein FEF09_10170 [Chitinophaga pinensis]
MEWEVKERIIRRVKEKGEIAFSWESGNDEAFLSFPDNINESDDFYDLKNTSFLSWTFRTPVNSR